MSVVSRVAALRASLFAGSAVVVVRGGWLFFFPLFLTPRCPAPATRRLRGAAAARPSPYLCARCRVLAATAPRTRPTAKRRTHCGTRRRRGWWRLTEVRQETTLTRRRLPASSPCKILLQHRVRTRARMTPAAQRVEAATAGVPNHLRRRTMLPTRTPTPARLPLRQPPPLSPRCSRWMRIVVAGSTRCRW